MLQDPRPSIQQATPADHWTQAGHVLEAALNKAGHVFLPTVWIGIALAAKQTEHANITEQTANAVVNYLKQGGIEYEAHRFVEAREIKHLPRSSLLFGPHHVELICEESMSRSWSLAIGISSPLERNKFSPASNNDLLTFWRKLQQSTWLKSAFALGRGGVRPVVQASFLINALALAAPLFSLQVYDRIIPNQAYASLFAIMFGVLLCLGFEYILKHARHQLMEHAATTIDAQCTAQLSRALLAAPTTNTEPSILLQHLRSFEHLRELITGVFLLALIDLPFLLLFALVIGIIHPLFLLITGGILALSIWRVLLAHRELAEYGRAHMGHSRQAQSRWLDTLANLEMVQAMGVQGAFAAQLDKIQLQARIQGNALRESLFKISHSTQSLQQLSWVFTVALGVYLVINQHITMGGMIAVSMLTMRCFAPVQKLQTHLLQLHTAQAGFEELDQFLGQTSPKLALQPLPLPKLEQIALTNASVLKPDKPGQRTTETERHLLQDINLTLRSGDRLGVIGATGSGKTSLLRLLAGQCHLSQGQYTINSLAMDHYHPAELAAHIGLALQPPVLLKGTLLENLQFKRPHINIQHCWHSLETMGLAQWVREHPDGLYMSIDSQGSNLSSGQKQAISLCRAFAGNPNLLLLDEPTVCLDQDLEQHLMQTIANLPAQVIVVFTTHKLSMLSASKQLTLLHRSKIHSHGDKPTVLHAAKALQNQITEKLR